MECNYLKKISCLNACFTIQFGSLSHDTKDSSTKSSSSVQKSISPTSTVGEGRDEERRSFSLSVDSGRSSDKGKKKKRAAGGDSVLLHLQSSSASSSSSPGSSSSSTSGENHQQQHSPSPPPPAVKIVPHSFCDFLGKGRNSLEKEEEEEEEKSEEEKPTLSSSPSQANKVTVFVPYSAISDIR